MTKLPHTVFQIRPHSGWIDWYQLARRIVDQGPAHSSFGEPFNEAFKVSRRGGLLTLTPTFADWEEPVRISTREDRPSCLSGHGSSALVATALMIALQEKIEVYSDLDHRFVREALGVAKIVAPYAQMPSWYSMRELANSRLNVSRLLDSRA